jgi:hypothetical protein
MSGDVTTTQVGLVLDALVDGLQMREAMADVDVTSSDRGAEWVLKTDKFLAFTHVHILQKWTGQGEKGRFETMTIDGDIAYTSYGYGEDTIRESREGALAILADFESFLAEDFQMGGQVQSIELSELDLDGGPTLGTSSGFFTELTFTVIVKTQIKPA